MKIKKITVNGKDYLGLIGVKDDISTLNSAMRVGKKNLGISDFAAYLKAMNAGDLEVIVFGGPGISYAISSLNNKEKLALAECQLKMRYAKINTLTGLENQYFTDLLEGKL